MPFCPQCKLEYRPGKQRCSDCGASLTAEAPKAPVQLRGQPAVRLCRLPDASAGDIVKAALAEAGIPAFVQRHGPITGELSRVTDGLTEDCAIVLVPEDRLEEARRILTVLESAPVEWPEGMSPED